MRFSPQLAEIRFGFGLSPEVAPPASVGEMLDGLTGPDRMADALPIPPLADFLPRIAEHAKLRNAARKSKDKSETDRLNREAKEMRRAAKDDHVRWSGQTFLRCVRTGDAFRERLVWFWADHFTAKGNNDVFLPAAAPYVEETIRPHVAGRFADLLKAAVKSPLMLHFLDQRGSVGPNSRMARKGKAAGLNENLAREVLELHTLGVDGPYTQDDVRQLAELFTGLWFDAQRGFAFLEDAVEPGAETVLGRRYGSAGPGMDTLDMAMEDIAAHPATARHIARKLAVHFVSDHPDPALIDHVATRFQGTGGDLIATCAALLEHPAAWQPEPGNVKPPADFIVSACRALAPTGLAEETRKPGRVNQLFLGPMAMMGQVWMRPGGPDGWPEADMSWVTPQALAVRLGWAMQVPERLVPSLPEPDRFAEAALGPFLSDTVRFAAGAAETRAEAIGLVLASPAFQRR